jgi:hypothetical protein
VLGSLEGFTPNKSVGTERSSVSNAALLSSYLESLGRSLIDGLLNLLSGAKGILNQGLPSFPVGTLPTAEGLLGGQSSSSNGNSGFELGVLALLATLLLSGRCLWSRWDFLRPDSALVLALERPG